MAKDGLDRNVPKRSRWLLLKRPENLDASRNEPERLQETLRLNGPLYYLKEELNEIWEQDNEKAAEALMMDWVLIPRSYFHSSPFPFSSFSH